MSSPAEPPFRAGHVLEIEFLTFTPAGRSGMGSGRVRFSERLRESGCVLRDRSWARRESSFRRQMHVKRGAVIQGELGRELRRDDRLDHRSHRPRPDHSHPDGLEIQSGEYRVLRSSRPSAVHVFLPIARITSRKSFNGSGNRCVNSDSARAIRSFHPDSPSISRTNRPVAQTSSPSRYSARG